MARPGNGYGLIRCSFCGKNAEQVEKIITGPSVHICNECVAMCNDILTEEGQRDVQTAHTTFVHTVQDHGIAFMLAYADGGTARKLTITDNILTSPAGYGIVYSEKKVGIESLNAMAGNSWTFKRNVIGGIEPQFAPWHPPGNWYPPTVAGIGFIDPPTGEYRLAPRSDYKGRGERGKDPGADLARLRKETAGVVVR